MIEKWRFSKKKLETKHNKKLLIDNLRRTQKLLIAAYNFAYWAQKGFGNPCRK